MIITCVFVLFLVGAYSNTESCNEVTARRVRGLSQEVGLIIIFNDVFQGIESRIWWHIEELGLCRFFAECTVVVPAVLRATLAVASLGAHIVFANPCPKSTHSWIENTSEVEHQIGFCKHVYLAEAMRNPNLGYLVLGDDSVIVDFQSLALLNRSRSWIYGNRRMFEVINPPPPKNMWLWSSAGEPCVRSLTGLNASWISRYTQLVGSATAFPCCVHEPYVGTDFFYVSPGASKNWRVVASMFGGCFDEIAIGLVMTLASGSDLDWFSWAPHWKLWDVKGFDLVVHKNASQLRHYLRAVNLNVDWSHYNSDVRAKTELAKKQLLILELAGDVMLAHPLKLSTPLIKEWVHMHYKTIWDATASRCWPERFREFSELLEEGRKSNMLIKMQRPKESQLREEVRKSKMMSQKLLESAVNAHAVEVNDKANILRLETALAEERSNKQDGKEIVLIFVLVVMSMISMGYPLQAAVRRTAYGRGSTSSTAEIDDGV